MTIIETFLFGFSLAIAIGPIAILILNQSITCGFRNGVFSGIGAALADFTYAISAFIAGNFLTSFLEVQKNRLPVFSSAVLIAFGIWMLYATFRKTDTAAKGNHMLTCKYPLATTYGLTLANPLTIVVFAGFAGTLSGADQGNAVLHALIIFIASLTVQLLIAFGGRKLARFITGPKALLYFNAASSLGIILLGIVKMKHFI